MRYHSDTATSEVAWIWVYKWYVELEFSRPSLVGIAQSAWWSLYPCCGGCRIPLVRAKVVMDKRMGETETGQAKS